MSYTLLLIYSYTKKPNYVKIIQSKTLEIMNKLKCASDFGKVYGVLIMTHVLIAFPQQTLDILLNPECIAYISAFQHNEYPHYDAQLLLAILTLMKNTYKQNGQKYELILT